MYLLPHSNLSFILFAIMLTSINGESTWSLIQLHLPSNEASLPVVLKLHKTRHKMFSSLQNPSVHSRNDKQISLLWQFLGCVGKHCASGKCPRKRFVHVTQIHGVIELTGLRRPTRHYWRLFSEARALVLRGIRVKIKPRTSTPRTTTARLQFSS